MATVKEQQEEITKIQLIRHVEDLINYMDLTSDLNIAIVEEETSGTSFIFSLEYPPYQENHQKFHRHVSNFEAEEFLLNVLKNIEEIMGVEYKTGDGFTSIFVPPNEKYRRNISVRLFSDSGKLLLFKNIHIKLFFVEAK